MRKYATYIMLRASDAAFVKLMSTKDFEFDYRDDPTFTNWEMDSGRYSSMVSLLPDSQEIEEYLSKGYKPAKELLVLAEDEDIAETVTRLVYCGSILEYPSPIELPEPPFCYEIEDDSHIVAAEHYLRQNISELALFGCVIACRAWRHDEVIYSLEKYRLSLTLDHFTPHSGHPIHGEMFEYSQIDYRRHVSAAYAALAAYSVVEELDVNIKSSRDNPRFLGAGEWNQVVMEDVLRRLTRIGVSEDESMLWSLRGDPTPMEMDIKPVLGRESEYCTYPEVRDRILKVHEAIHYASYIRNYFLAHKFRDLTKHITPYDVNNIQSLARLLLLSKLGLWKKNREDVVQQLMLIRF